MSADPSEIENLKFRLAEAERQLSRIRFGLKVGLVLAVLLVLCALVPPLSAIAGLAFYGIIVLGALFAYMYGVAWAAERLTSAVGGDAPRSDHNRQ